jgi:RHS repeat-associated protein
MACPAYTYYPIFELQKKRFKKELTSAKSILNARSVYLFGFNGKEKDDEVKGSGNSYDFGARIYDARLGRWLAMDPLQVKCPQLSPYNFVANSPLIFIDPDGKRIKPASDGDYADMNLLFDEGFVNKDGKTIDGGELLGVTMSNYVQTPGDRSSIITIYSTNLSEKEFNKKLKNRNYRMKIKNMQKRYLQNLNLIRFTKLQLLMRLRRPLVLLENNKQIQVILKNNVLTSNPQSDALFGTLEDKDKIFSKKNTKIDQTLGSDGTGYFENTNANSNVMGITIVKEIVPTESVRASSDTEAAAAQKTAQKATTARLKKALAE